MDFFNDEKPIKIYFRNDSTPKVEYETFSKDTKFADIRSFSFRLTAQNELGFYGYGETKDDLIFVPTSSVAFAITDNTVK